MTIALVCPWSFGGTTDPATQKVIPPECNGRTWSDKPSFVEHLVTDHGGLRGWTRESALREANEQWLAREQAEIDATQGETPDPCGAMLVFPFPTTSGEAAVAEFLCGLSVHAGDHRYTSDDGRVSISWQPEEEPLSLLEAVVQ